MQKIEQLSPRAQAEIAILTDAFLVATADETAQLTEATRHCTGGNLLPALRVADQILRGHAPTTGRTKTTD